MKKSSDPGRGQEEVLGSLHVKKGWEHWWRSRPSDLCLPQMEAGSEEQGMPKPPPPCWEASSKFCGGIKRAGEYGWESYSSLWGDPKPGRWPAAIQGASSEKTQQGAAPQIPRAAAWEKEALDWLYYQLAESMRKSWHFCFSFLTCG